MLKYPLLEDAFTKSDIKSAIKVLKSKKLTFDKSEFQNSQEIEDQGFLLAYLPKKLRINI